MFGNSRGILRRLLPVGSLAIVLALSGCQTQHDAVAAAQQLSTTFAVLQRYYTSLEDIADHTAEAQAAQSYLNGIPFDDLSRSQLRTLHDEFKQRADMAATLARLAALFADITNSNAPADAAKAANDLNAELVALKAFKSSSTETEALKVATNAVMNVIKSHDEVKAAKLILPLVTALSAFFDSEADLYQSTADVFYVTAASNSSALIDRNQVSAGFLYRSSLAPFGLNPDITDPALRSTSGTDLKTRVADRLADHQQQDKTAVTDLATALHVMRDRVALVANGKPLRATLPPLTLDGVRAWVNETLHDLGEN